MGTTRDLFARKQLRCTTQRLAIYDALHERADHPTAEELYHTVKPATNRLSLATVYNTLEALCRAGLARKLPTANGSCRYDADTSEHIHLLVRESDEIHDVPNDIARNLLAQVRSHLVARIEAQMGVKIEGIEVKLVASRRNGMAAASP